VYVHAVFSVGVVCVGGGGVVLKIGDIMLINKSTRISIGITL